MSILLALIAFIIVIGILVTVHEFGHYWVAKKLGVKILRFSIGFGKPLINRPFGKDRTEFVIAPIPLGGYVKMLGEGDTEEEISPEDLPRAFSQQPLWIRTAIVAAGPLFNFIFAILTYALMYMLGIQGLQAIVGEVDSKSLAEQAGFKSGYHILAVEQEPVHSWESVLEESINHLIDRQPTISYLVKTPTDSEYTLYLNTQNISIDDIAEGQFFKKIGLQPFRPLPPAKIEAVTPDSPAEKGGLKAGDEVLRVEGQPIENWLDWAQYISTHPGETLIVTVAREGREVQLQLTPQEDEDGKGRLGIYGPRHYQIPDKYLFTEYYTPWQALWEGTVKTWEMSVLTLRLLWKMLTLEISANHISGPITIADYAGKSVQIGFTRFLQFLALVSLSLGVINLLPIPVLDGGHLFLYFIELIKGSPVTETTQSILQQIGLVLLIGLMGLAIFNDLGRLLG